MIDVNPGVLVGCPKTYEDGVQARPSRTKLYVFGNIRKHLGDIFHELARQKECPIIEGHLMPDQVHICIPIPPKYVVASVIGFLKGKTAIAIARQFAGRERNFTGEHFLIRRRADLSPKTDDRIHPPADLKNQGTLASSASL